MIIMPSTVVVLHPSQLYDLFEKVIERKPKQYPEQIWHQGECFVYKNPRWPGWIVKGEIHQPISLNTKSWLPRFRKPISEIKKTEEEILTRIKVVMWQTSGKPLEKHGIIYTPIRRFGRNLGFRDPHNYWYIWSDNEHLFHREEDCSLLERMKTNQYVWGAFYKVRESGIIVKA